jgi:hypothetical protein
MVLHPGIGAKQDVNMVIDGNVGGVDMFKRGVEDSFCVVGER